MADIKSNFGILNADYYSQLGMVFTQNLNFYKQQHQTYHTNSSASPFLEGRHKA
jgi:hypothetical protein